MISNTLQHLDLKSLTGLLYLLEERHVGKAASRLSLSQSAMSRLLIRLRDAFNDPLFIRTAKGMVPTTKALELEAPIRNMLEQMLALESPSDFQPQTSTRTFRLQTTHYLAQTYVPAIAERFYQEAPLACLETTTVTENSLLNEAEHSADMVLCSEYIHVPDTYQKTLLGYEKFRCIMAKNHPLAKNETITLDDYLSYPHVLVSLGGSRKVMSDTILGSRAHERRFAFRTPYFLSALETVGRTSLLISTSVLLTERFSKQFGLTIKPLPVEFPDSHYYLCWPKPIEKDPAIKWFRNLTEEVAKGLIPYPNL